MKKKLLIIPTILLAASLTACNLSFIDKMIGVEEESEEIESRPTSSEGSSEGSSSYSSLDDVLVASITLNTNEVSLNPGQEYTLQATVLPKNAKNKTLSWSSDNAAVATVSNDGLITAINGGTAYISASSTDGSERVAVCEVEVVGDVSQAINKAVQKYTYYDLDTTGTVAPTGEQKVLVIPTYFTDDTAKATEANYQFIQKSFFGTNAECGWRSFTGYYKEASYDQLNYSGYVSPDWYNSGIDKNTAATEDSSSQTIASNALKWFKQNNPTFDLDPYDSNNDGYIDSLYIIYASDYDPDTNLWGYRWTTTVDSGTGKKARAFSWFSLKFLTNTNDYGGVPSSGSNTRIIIHEHGHMLGLEDYYDTSYSGIDLIGGFDMQDRNVFDWNAFSKYSVGWTQPYYINEDVLKEKGEETITIGSLAETGECILVRNKEWNGSPFDEYLLLELFNPDAGNNLYDSTLNTQSGINLTGYGVKVFHVDARMARLSLEGGAHLVPTDTIGSGQTIYIPNDNTYKESSEHNYYGRYYGFTEWEDYHLLQMIQKENVNTFDTTDDSLRHEWKQSDLFLTGDTFSLGSHTGYTDYGPNFFYHNSTFNDGSELPYGIEFVSVSKNSATIKFTYFD